MSFFQKAKNIISGEFTKLRKISPKDRVWYIWEYYKLAILGVAFAVIFVASIAASVLNPSEVYLQNALINISEYDSPEPTPLTSEFHVASNLTENDLIENRLYQLSFSAPYTEDDYRLVQALQIMTASKELDLIFTNASDLQNISAMGICANLEEVLPANLWNDVKDSVVYGVDPETGINYPVGISVAEFPVIRRCSFLSDTVVLSISVTTPRLNHCITMIRYILNR